MHRASSDGRQTVGKRIERTDLIDETGPASPLTEHHDPAQARRHVEASSAAGSDRHRRGRAAPPRSRAHEIDMLRAPAVVGHDRGHDPHSPATYAISGRPDSARSSCTDVATASWRTANSVSTNSDARTRQQDADMVAVDFTPASRSAAARLVQHGGRPPDRHRSCRPSGKDQRLGLAGATVPGFQQQVAAASISRNANRAHGNPRFSSPPIVPLPCASCPGVSPG